mgnify:CR=1 FL=1
MKKILLATAFILAGASLFFIVRPAESRLASYYSGDAIAYKGQVYVGTTNTGSLEIFKLVGNDLALIVNQRVLKPSFNSYDDYFDVKFNEENGRLYVYAVSHYTVFKYELANNALNLVKESQNTYWEWYNRVDKFGDTLVLVSARGIKTMNTDLELISSYDFNNLEAPYNLNGPQSRFILNVNESGKKLEIYDRESRSLVRSIPLEFKHERGNRRAFQDATGYFYTVDDVYTKKFDLEGRLVGSFKHLDFQGFDVQASSNTGHIYFSNGVGVVKLDKDMKLLDYAWATNFGGQNSWSMGIKTVYNQGDKVVVFNNSNITVLDDNLNKVASAVVRKEAREYPTENLFLNLDKYQAAADSQIAVSGGGFLAKETLTIYFDGREVKNNVTTDHRGRFAATITVPDSTAGLKDVKVVSDNSQISYSISFRLEK